MRLEKYIEQVGDKPAAKLFGVSHRTTQAWRYKSRKPKPEKAKEIVRITQGKVSLEECF